MPELTPVRLKLTAQATAPILFAKYPGATLRGAFGQSLRALSCVTKAPTCDACPLVATCPYTQIFAPNEISTAQGAAKLPSYIVTPIAQLPMGEQNPQTLRRYHNADEEFSFHFTIWGAARQHLALIIMAWQRALARKIGLKIPNQTPSEANSEGSDEDTQTEFNPAGQAILLNIEAVSSNGALLPIWSVEAAQINNENLTLAQYAPQPAPDWLAKGCQISLLTPLRLPIERSIAGAQRLTAQAVLQGIERRLRNLEATEFLQKHLTEKQPSASLNDELPILTKHLSWADSKRYSSTQQQLTPLGGLIGNLDFKGDMRPYWPALYAGQWLNFGKETVFGLGAYYLRPSFSK